MKKRYWLKFAIALAGISLIVGVLLMNSEGGELLLVITHSIVALPFLLLLVYGLGFQSSSSSEDLIIVLLGTVSYFIVGMLVGLIYGKIKNRKKSIQ